MWNKVISKFFQPSSTSVWNNLASRLFQNHFSGVLQLVNIFQPVHCRWNNFNSWNNFEIISDVITCEIKHWNNFEIISVFYFTCNYGITVLLLSCWLLYWLVTVYTTRLRASRHNMCLNNAVFTWQFYLLFLLSLICLTNLWLLYLMAHFSFCNRCLVMHPSVVNVNVKVISIASLTSWPTAHYKQ